MEKNKEEEYYLRNINAKEWSIVDNPAIDEGWLILKRANTDDLIDEDSTYFYCEKCELKIVQKDLHEKARCPQCNEIIGIERNNEKEMKKQMADKEKSKEEIKKVSVKEAAQKAAEVLEQATGGSDKEKKRLVLLIANLKSLAGIKKSAEEDELIEKFDSFEEYVEDITKAGKKVSKETATSISEIANSLRKAVEALELLAKEGPGRGKDKKEYGYPDIKKNVDKELDDILSFYKDGLIEDDEVRGLLSLVNEGEQMEVAE